jgi:hypothetical protein
MADNIIADDFFNRAEAIRKEIGVNHLVGITSGKVADANGRDVTWNYFTGTRDFLSLVSSYAMRNYASRAGRPFEVAIAQLVVSQFLVSLHYPKLYYHPESRGCFFDYNGQRDMMVQSLKALRIEPECLMRIDSQVDREAAAAIEVALRNYVSAGEET